MIHWSPSLIQRKFNAKLIGEFIGRGTHILHAAYAVTEFALRRANRLYERIKEMKDNEKQAMRGGQKRGRKNKRWTDRWRSGPLAFGTARPVSETRRFEPEGEEEQGAGRGGGGGAGRVSP